MRDDRSSQANAAVECKRFTTSKQSDDAILIASSCRQYQRLLCSLTSSRRQVWPVAFERLELLIQPLSSWRQYGFTHPEAGKPSQKRQRQRRPKQDRTVCLNPLSITCIPLLDRHDPWVCQHSRWFSRESLIPSGLWHGEAKLVLSCNVW